MKTINNIPPGTPPLPRTFIDPNDSVLDVALAMLDSLDEDADRVRQTLDWLAGVRDVDAAALVGAVAGIEAARQVLHQAAKTLALLLARGLDKAPWHEDFERELRREREAEAEEASRQDKKNGRKRRGGKR